jgi:F-type H+-transporting ATPase subunit delta
MSVTRIAGRYAKALLDLAQEQGKVAEVVGDMQSFQEATKHREFYLLLKSPIVNATKKESIFKALFEDKYNRVTLAFLNIILDKGRESMLPEVATEFMNQYKATQGISSVKITTATPMSDDAVEAIRAKLIASKLATPNLDMQTVVNPNLIGGFIIEFDDKLYNASVAHQLENIKTELFSTNLHVNKVQNI